MKKRILSVLLALMLCACLTLSVSASYGTAAPGAGNEFLVDGADLLSDAEEAELRAKLAEISSNYEAQIVVYTMASAYGISVDSYLDEIYDSNYYGYGANRDGVLLLVCMDPREYRILSNGYAGVAIHSGTISDIGDVIVSDLSAGDYADAFHGFADECAYYLDGYLNGYPFDAGNTMLISLTVGIAIGLIVVFVLKGQLKSVQKQNRAHSYIKPDSMNIRLSNEVFLYRNITRTRKETSKSSGSGGGSARSRGGGSF